MLKAFCSVITEILQKVAVLGFLLEFRHTARPWSSLATTAFWSRIAAVGRRLPAPVRLRPPSAGPLLKPRPGEQSSHRVWSKEWGEVSAAHQGRPLPDHSRPAPTALASASCPMALTWTASPSSEITLPAAKSPLQQPFGLRRTCHSCCSALWPFTASPFQNYALLRLLFLGAVGCPRAALLPRTHDPDF